MWVNKHLAQRPFSHYTASSQKFDFDSAKIQGLLLGFEAMAYKLDGFSQYSKMVYTKWNYILILRRRHPETPPSIFLQVGKV